MASVKVVLRKNVKVDGTYPLALRITKDRETSYVYLGHSLRLADWDAGAQRVKKSYPNATRFNHFLAKKLAEFTEKLLEMETNHTDTSSRAIRSASVSAKKSTFFNQATAYCEHLEKTDKFNQLSSDASHIKHFKEFLKGADIHFAEITPALLKKFIGHLKSTRTITDRTVANHLVTLRTIFNQGIAAGVTDQKHYPFGRGKILIKFPESLKIGLTADEVKRLEDIELSEGENHARNLWLFSFYFAGMRVSDVLRLKWSDFQNERLYYTMGKNRKGGSLKIPEKAARILEQYPRDTPHELVFPDLASLSDLTKAYDVQLRIKTTGTACNIHLKRIAKKIKLTKPLTMHIARHTFGNLSGDKISVHLLQKLYRHTSITTTVGYQRNFIHKDADEALDAVLS